MENKSNFKYRIYHILFVVYVLACIAGGVFIAMKSQSDFEKRKLSLQKGADSEVTTFSSVQTIHNSDNPLPVSKEIVQKRNEMEKKSSASAFPPQVPTLMPQKKESEKNPVIQHSVVKNEVANSTNSATERMDMEMHRKIVKKLQDKIKTQEITIKDLKATVDSLKKNMKMDLAKLKKPVSKFVAECYGMEVGTWNVDQECIRKAQKTIKRMAKKYSGIIAWEVLPVVDSRPYKGLSPELKQEGLASFRAQAGIKLIHDTLKKEVIAFKGMTIKEEVKRGFIIKVHYLK